MRIAIDTNPLTNANKKRGVGVYTRNLIDALSKISPTHTFFYFRDPQELPESIDLVHYPYFDPFELTLPRSKRYTQIVTVHDLTPIVHRSHFQIGLRGTWKWMIQRESLRRVAHVITDSLASKKDIHRLVGIPESSISTIYLAPRDIGKRSDGRAAKTFFKRVSIDPPYFLYVGDINWNKNIEGLLKAFAEYQKKAKEPLLLVMVGEAFLSESIEADEIRSLVNALHIETSVRFTGGVTDSELAVLYSGARATIQPSFYEGFGFPVLEAMSNGCPVITSDQGSLKEIAGPAIPVDPYDIQTIERAMDGITELSREKRNQLVKKGRLWAQKFTWEKTAVQTLEAYEKALS